MTTKTRTVELTVTMTVRYEATVPADWSQDKIREEVSEAADLTVDQDDIKLEPLDWETDVEFDEDEDDEI